MQIYIYNVTNADEFLNNGEKPALQELGPYVYMQSWEKTDVKFNENGTVTYKVKKTYVFSEVGVPPHSNVIARYIVNLNPTYNGPSLPI